MQSKGQLVKVWPFTLFVRRFNLKEKHARSSIYGTNGVYINTLTICVNKTSWTINIVVNYTTSNKSVNGLTLSVYRISMIIQIINFGQHSRRRFRFCWVLIPMQLKLGWAVYNFWRAFEFGCRFGKNNDINFIFFLILIF